MSEEEKEAIEYYEQPENAELCFGCDFNSSEILEALGVKREEIDSFGEHVYRFDTLIKLIRKQQMEITELCRDRLIDDAKCLRCGSGKPGYCEDCFQKLIAENAELQKDVKDAMDGYHDYGKEIYMRDMKIEKKVNRIKKLAEEILKIC